MGGTDFRQNIHGLVYAINVADGSVDDGRTVIVPPTWATLQIDVVDEQFVPFRGTYELIRMDTREDYGVGFGADEQPVVCVTSPYGLDLTGGWKADPKIELNDQCLRVPFYLSAPGKPAREQTAQKEQARMALCRGARAGERAEEIAEEIRRRDDTGARWRQRAVRDHDRQDRRIDETPDAEGRRHGQHAADRETGGRGSLRYRHARLGHARTVWRFTVNNMPPSQRGGLDIILRPKPMAHDTYEPG